MKTSTFLSAAVTTIVFAGSVQAETRKVTIHAPFDGLVESVAGLNTEFAPQTPPALFAFNDLRKTTGTVTHPLAVRNLPQAPAADFVIPLVVNVTSEILDLQLAEETRKLEAAQARVTAASTSYDLEKKLKPTAVTARTAQDEEGRYLTEHNRNIYHSDSGLSQSDANAYASNANTGRGAYRQIFDDRLNYLVDKDMPNRLKIAQKELSAANYSVQIVNATLKLGQIVCPSHCKVIAVHVFQQQWVTKGDPLVEVEIDQ